MQTGRISFRLRAYVAGIFLMLFLVVLSTVSYLNEISRSQGQHYRLLGVLEQLEDASRNLKHRGEYYVKNAPRDYESYFRDIAVFHREMQDDIASFEQKLLNVVDEYTSNDYGVLSLVQRRFYGEDWSGLEDKIQKSQGEWDTFKVELIEALGENKEEPRLEWGAQYIVNHADGLSGKLTDMITEYRSLTDATEANSKRLSVFVVVATGIVMVLGLALMQWIVWRVGKAAKACEIVANGDFGYQIPDASNDEIGQMTRAFNSLSSRVSLVLGLLTKLNTAKEPGDALSAFWSDSQRYLDADWIGLLIQSTDGRHLVLMHQHSKSVTKAWQNRRIDLQEGSDIELKVSQALETQSALLFEDVRQDTKEISSSLFFRELIQKTMPSSFVMLPLVNHDASWKAGLIVAKGLHKQFSADQMELLNNLAPVIGSIFANATSNKTVAVKKIVKAD